MAYRLLTLTSVADLRTHAAAWNALWERSDVTIPTVQAELLAQWLEHFGHAKNFHAVVVERNGRILAALPLFSRRIKGVLGAGVMASNDWTPASDVLLDPTADDGVLELLAQGLAAGPWSLLWLDFAITDSDRWKRLVAACERVGWTTDMHSHFRLPRIDIHGSWEDYRASWSRNHRQSLARARRKLVADHGELRLRFFAPMPDELPALLQQGFGVEDRSWKGAAGSSVLRMPGMPEFFEAQAKFLNERGQLEIAFLEVSKTDGEEPHPNLLPRGEGTRAIAFMYGWNAKGVFHAFKAGYDEAFAEYSPGQLMIHEILEQFFRTQSHRMFDCIGPATEATMRWQTSDYEAGRVVIAPRNLIGQAAYFAYKHLVPTLRRWRNTIRSATPKHSVASSTA